MVAHQVSLSTHEKRLSLGVFPAVSLQAARLRCIELRAQVAAGVDPSALRRASKNDRTSVNETFEAMAREWHKSSSRAWADSHADRNLRRLESYVFPWIGTTPIRKVLRLTSCPPAPRWLCAWERRCNLECNRGRTTCSLTLCNPTTKLRP